MSNLDTKLNALLSKDLDYLVSKQAIITGLTSPYSKIDLQAWVQKRVDIVNKLKASSDLNKDYSDTKATMTSKDQVIVESIENKEPHVSLLETADDYDKLIEVILNNFALN